MILVEAVNAIFEIRELMLLILLVKEVDVLGDILMDEMSSGPDKLNSVKLDVLELLLFLLKNFESFLLSLGKVLFGLFFGILVGGLFVRVFRSPVLGSCRFFFLFFGFFHLEAFNFNFFGRGF